MSLGLRRTLAAIACTLIFAEVAAASPRTGASAESVWPVGIPKRDCPDCPFMVHVPAPVGAAPLLAGVYEVTWREYLESYFAGACPFPHIFWQDKGVSEREQARMLNVDWPVTGVSLAKIRCYTDWLKRKTGRNYRLPTREEWMWIARGGTTTRFPWGNEWPKNVAAVNGPDGKVLAERPPYSSSSNLAGEKVGQFPPNGYGLYDIMGNVRELTSVCRDRPALKPLPAGCLQVVKDVTWPEERAGIAGELYVRQDSDLHEAGFRLVADVDRGRR
jgi:formylglycine-generating enzyme required for sulfatase activity